MVNLDLPKIFPWIARVKALRNEEETTCLLMERCVTLKQGENLIASRKY